MAFFTRPRFNIPPLPADDVWGLASVLLWLNMKYLSNFLSSWSTKFFLLRLQDMWPADEDPSVSHFQKHLCGNDTPEHTRYAVTDDSPAVQFLFGEDDFQTISLNFWVTSVCAYKKLEDGNKSRFGQIHCTVTYFIVLFLEGNKKTLPAF